MLQYTKQTLKAHLAQWVEGNGLDADATFVADLDEIIQLGEIRAMRDLDLESFDTVANTVTVASTEQVAKPAQMIVERLVVASIAGVKRQLIKKSRAYVDAMNRAGATGESRYYAEYDEDEWTFAPIPSGAWTVYVHAQYRPASIIDGADGNTTWLSTHFPDVLAAACCIEAAHHLKNWARKAIEEADYVGKLDDARSMTTSLRRSDVDQIVRGRLSQREVTVAPSPPATT